MYVSGQGDIPSISLSFLCWDNKDEKFVRFFPHKEFDLDSVFSLFKRFEIIIGQDINDIEVDDDDNLNLV